LSFACGDKKETGKAETPPTARPANDAGASSPTSSPEGIDAGSAPRDWLCSVLDKVPKGGRFGAKEIKKRHPKHAGITNLVMRSNSQGQLNLAVLSEDDAENDRGLLLKALSPKRGVQAFRFSDEQWEDLGRVFQLIGWGVTLEGSITDGPPAYAVSTGIGDVRRAMVASCESGKWIKQARFLEESFEAAALTTSASPGTIENVSIRRGLYADVGKDCKPVAQSLGGKIPVWLQAPKSLAKDDTKSSITFSEPGDCRPPRRIEANQKGDSVVVSYEQCEQEDGGDTFPLVNCQVTTVWFTDGEWKRLAPFTKLAGSTSDPRHAIALGDSGPLLAVAGADGLALHQGSAETWNPLPPLPGGKGCRVPIALRADPARIVLRSCSAPQKVSAFRLDGEKWKPVGGSFVAKSRWGAQRRPKVVADWIGSTPYLAVGYYGAPVARVFEGQGSKWQQILEAVVDPTGTKN
jgi:hypothetical protein